jgi:hypothetical protein
MGERRYSSYSYLTSALDGGEWSVSRPSCALPLGKGPPVPIEQEAGRAPEPVWTQRLEETSSASVGDRSPSYKIKDDLKSKLFESQQKILYNELCCMAKYSCYSLSGEHNLYSLS